MKKQDQSKTNFKNKKNRINLYNRSFMKWNLESRIATLQEQAIQLSLHSGSFLHDIENPEKYKAFSEAIGSLETMIEVAKQSIDPLAETSSAAKYIKLQNLKDHTDKVALENIEVKDPEEIKHKEGGLTSELTPEEKERIEVGHQYIKNEKTFFQKLIFWKS